MDISRWAGVLATMVGIGANIVIREFDMAPQMKMVVGWGGIVLMVGGVGAFVFAYLPLEVRRTLHLVSREGQRRWRRAEQEIAALTPAEKLGLWMYLENPHEKESRIREELQRRGMEVPNYELFGALHSKTSFMRLEFGGSEGVRQEWQGIVRGVLLRDPPWEKQVAKRWPSLFVALLSFVAGAGLVAFFGGTVWRAENLHTPATACDIRIGENGYERLLKVLQGLHQALPKLETHIIVEPGMEKSCSYAQDLYAVFARAGWKNPPVRSRGTLDGGDVWVYGFTHDPEAGKLCSVLEEQGDPKVTCCANKDEDLHERVWEIFVKDGPDSPGVTRCPTPAWYEKP